MAADAADAIIHRAEKFQHPDKTAKGEARASVALTQLETLWVNTGTLCNIECDNCYIESSPVNDRLAYLTAAEPAPFLDEAKTMGATEIGFTGGEPFLNPQMIAMSEAALSRGFSVLVLTNAMRPMQRPKVQAGLLNLREKFGAKLTLRISLDHYARNIHNDERGPGAFNAALTGIDWLVANKFSISIAGRNLTGEAETISRDGFAALFADRAIPLDAHNPHDLVIFPEMDTQQDVPEITEACWDILGKNPAEIMCASSRMLVKRKGASAAAVVSCTLLPYDGEFELGASLAEAAAPVKLNHPFCAQFCVLGGASCSG